MNPARILGAGVGDAGVVHGSGLARMCVVKRKKRQEWVAGSVVFDEFVSSPGDTGLCRLLS